MWRPDLSDKEFAEVFDDFPDNRRTGRTTRLLNVIPEGTTYIVSSPGVIPYILEYARKIGKEDINVISSNQIKTWLRGHRTSVAIDHCCFFDVVRDQDLCVTLDFQKEIYYNGKNNSVICQSRNPDTGEWTLNETA